MSLAERGGRTAEDLRFLQLAFDERARSDDPKAAFAPRSAVGAVIARDGVVIARSSNVLPPQLKAHHDAHRLTISELERYHLIEHAERAAIYEGSTRGLSLEGATIYCTRFPCSDCARAIVWAGIKRAVLATGISGERRWIEAQRAAREILKRGGVTVRVLKIGDCQSSSPSSPGEP